MSEENRFYEISGEGFESVGDLCDALRTSLSDQGINLLLNNYATSSNGVPATRNRATGVVCLKDTTESPALEMDVVLYRKTVDEGDSFLDYKFQMAVVRPANKGYVANLEKALETILAKQQANRRPRRKLATASSAPNPDF